VINLLTIEKEELEQHIVSWGHPKYRVNQVWTWIRDKGVTSVDDMNNIPKKLKADLKRYTKKGSLELATELISKDGTIKRVYRLHDGQLIESVLMPYKDGRYTACISSQAGCAMGCVFCATGQMGFARQLAPEEIFEQAARFASELASEQKRLSNVVFMGMGEPMANYRNVAKAVRRLTDDLGIGARKITVSTVGVVPSIRRLTSDPDFPQVRLAVSLHCASDAERTKLMPANSRYGGLDELMMALKDYIDTTKRRITLEWALIENQNDDLQTVQQLGNLIKRFGIRRDMIHVNVIPLNPTGGFGGSPSGRASVNNFCNSLEQQFGIACTPRVRRGIDIEAGCGQLKSTIQRKEDEEKQRQQDEFNLIDVKKESSVPQPSTPLLHGQADDVSPGKEHFKATAAEDLEEEEEFAIAKDTIDMDSDHFDDPEFSSDSELKEAERLVRLVQASFPPPEEKTKATAITDQDAVAKTTSITDQDVVTKMTSITDQDAVTRAKKRRKKLLKNLKSIRKLRERQLDHGLVWNEEQRLKISKEEEWKGELESVEHNLK